MALECSENKTSNITAFVPDGYTIITLEKGDRSRMLKSGYEPTPLLTGRKGTHVTGWQLGDVTPLRLAQEAKFPGYGNLGLRTGKLVAVDNDCLDPVLVNLVNITIDKHLGASPVHRVGSKLGGHHYYRSSTDFPGKLVVSGKDENGVEHKVEILGRGFQSAAFGEITHDNQGNPLDVPFSFTWRDGKSPINTPLADLPEHVNETFVGMMREIFDLFGECFLSDIKKQGFDQPVIDPSDKRGEPIEHDDFMLVIGYDTPAVDRAEWQKKVGAMVESEPLLENTPDGFDMDEIIRQWSRGEHWTGKKDGPAWAGDVPTSWLKGEDAAVDEMIRSMRKGAGRDGNTTYGSLVNEALANGMPVKHPDLMNKYGYDTDSEIETQAKSVTTSPLEKLQQEVDRLLAPDTVDIEDLAMSAVEATDMIDGAEPRAAEFIVGTWFEKHEFNLLQGPGGSWKSRFLRQLMMCARLGVPFIGQSIDTSVSFVLLTAEDTLDVVNRDFRTMTAALTERAATDGYQVRSAEFQQVHVLDRTRKKSSLFRIGTEGVQCLPFLASLVTYMQGIPGHKVLVLDSDYDYFEWADLAAIDRTTVNMFCKVLMRWLMQVCDCTIIDIKHPTQAGEDRGDMSGESAAWRNAVRVRLSMNRRRRDDASRDKSAKAYVAREYELHANKISHAEDGWVLHLRNVGGILVPVTPVSRPVGITDLDLAFYAWAVQFLENTGEPPRANVKITRKITAAIRAVALPGSTATSQKTLGVKLTIADAESSRDRFAGGLLRAIERDTNGKVRPGLYPAHCAEELAVAVAAGSFKAGETKVSLPPILVHPSADKPSMVDMDMVMDTDGEVYVKEDTITESASQETLETEEADFG